MSDGQQQTNPPSGTGADVPSLFSSQPPGANRSRRGVFLAAAAAALVFVSIGVPIFMHDRRAATLPGANAMRAEDPYGQSLSFTHLQMSQSTSLSGGASTFIDGHVHNGGTSTLTGVTMQVVFRNDVALPPDVETLPLSLIRMHEPYIDTEPVSAAPLVPGAESEFRLIFETIPSNWNQQMPEMKVVAVTKK